MIWCSSQCASRHEWLWMWLSVAWLWRLWVSCLESTVQKKLRSDFSPKVGLAMPREKYVQAAMSHIWCPTASKSIEEVNRTSNPTIKTRRAAKWRGWLGGVLQVKIDPVVKPPRRVRCWKCTNANLTGRETVVACGNLPLSLNSNDFHSLLPKGTTDMIW